MNRRDRCGRIATGLAALLSVAVLSSCSESDGDDRAFGATPTTASADTPAANAEDLLGEPNPAEGEPVKIGFVSDGKAAVLDNTIEFTAAEATVEWLNERNGGIGGRPIELVTCESKDAAAASACGRQMVQERVAAVAFKEITGAELLWQPLHDAGIPVMAFTSQDPLSADAASTFVLTDSTVAGVEVPLAVAKEVGADKATVVIIDVPGAADTVQDAAGPAFEDAGIELAFVRIPPGTADMTSQLSPLASDGTDVAFVVGYDAFCIAAFKGLAQVGYDGRIVSIQQCFSDATSQALTGPELEGIRLWATTTIGDPEDPDTQLFNAVMTEYDPSISTSDDAAFATFALVTALHNGVAGLTGDVTPASIIEALKTMPSTPLHAGAGREFQCGGSAVPEAPANCTAGALVTTLGPDGLPGEYTLVGSSDDAN